jgi:AcrR family transcriptional regulator
MNIVTTHVADSSTGAPSPEDPPLLDALETIFLTEGYRSVTLRSLATRLGCSYRKIYAVAATKEDLFLKIAKRFFNRITREGWAQANSSKALADRITDYLRVGISAAARTTPKFNEDIAALPAGRLVFDAHQEERIRGLAELVEEGIRSGEFEGFHSQLVAEVMIGAVKRVRQPDFLATSDMTFSEALSEISRLVRLGLVSRR